MMKPEDGPGKEYEIYRMLPPGSHRYFFSIDGAPKVAQEQKRTEKKVEKKEKKLLLDLNKLEIPQFDGDTTNFSPKKGMVDSKKATPKNVRAKEAAPEKEPDPDYYELNLPEVNYIENIH